jgi:divalent metal cation (Fe/Co/Zn/Cd) transporter
MSPFEITIIVALVVFVVIDFFVYRYLHKLVISHNSLLLFHHYYLNGKDTDYKMKLNRFPED